MHDIHGELLLGTPGAIAVELAGAWAVVMLITGLYLWWPRASGVGGVLYPRLDGGTRQFLRDIHAVTGLWLSLLALLLLISALPWTTVWGSELKSTVASSKPLSFVRTGRQDRNPPSSSAWKPSRMLPPRRTKMSTPSTGTFRA